MFPSSSRLPSTASAPTEAGLFGSFAGTTRLSDSRRSFISGYGLGLPLTARPAIDLPPREPSRTGHQQRLTGDHRASRFSRMEIPRMPGFSDRAGSDGHSHNATNDVAFRPVVRRRHPELADFAAQ